MNKRSCLVLILMLIVSMLLCACAKRPSAPIIPDQPAFGDLVLSKGIKTQGLYGIPTTPTSDYSTEDVQVVASLPMRYLSGSNTLRWEWYAPSGAIYYSTGDHPVEVPKGKYIEKTTTWHSLAIKGDRAETLPGSWYVNVYHNDVPIAVKAFTLSSPTFSRRKSYAVVVGISQYEFEGKNGLTDLPYADDDARDFYGNLLSLGWDKDHIYCLVDEKATLRAITIALESWLTKAGKDDLIVLYWSGHGFHDPNDPERVYFACYDTDPSIPPTGYRMDNVVKALTERRTKNVVIIADACHAGKLISRGTKGLSILPYVERCKREQKVPKGWVYMVGADTDREAIEHSAWSNGAFTHCLLNALSGKADGYESVGVKDGQITMREIRAYLESTMPDETQRILGIAKRPIITTSTGDPDIWNLKLSMEKF